ncbi:MAG: hypothetical protein ABII08_00260 [Candidatus Beckwithbacteria bacterium]
MVFASKKTLTLKTKNSFIHQLNFSVGQTESKISGQSIKISNNDIPIKLVYAVEHELTTAKNNQLVKKEQELYGILKYDEKFIVFELVNFPPNTENNKGKKPEPVLYSYSQNQITNAFTCRHPNQSTAYHLISSNSLIRYPSA